VKALERPPKPMCGLGGLEKVAEGPPKQMYSSESGGLRRLVGGYSHMTAQGTCASRGTHKVIA
jgi:hypothetical protein